MMKTSLADGVPYGFGIVSVKIIQIIEHVCFILKYIQIKILISVLELICPQKHSIKIIGLYNSERKRLCMLGCPYSIN